jgi:hypothetical protein
LTAAQRDKERKSWRKNVLKEQMKGVENTRKRAGQKRYDGKKKRHKD